MQPDLPIKRCSRLFILDDVNRLFLFRYESEDHPSFWATAGGQLRGDEDYVATATRELHEETGFVATIGPIIRERTEAFRVAEDELACWTEKYFLVRTSAANADSSRWSGEERRTIKEWRWWSLPEMEGSGEVFLPECLPELLAETIEHSAAESEPK